VDKLTSKKYTKTINLLCAGERLTPTNPPLRTTL